MVRPEALSAAQARRIILAAQGFADPRPAGRVDARHVRRVLDRVAVLQIDSVNVLTRSHYLPVFSRLGPYPRDLLDRMAWGRRRELFEYWGHAASLLPLHLQPFLRWRMRRTGEGPPGEWFARVHARDGFLDEVRTLVATHGPVGASATGEVRPDRVGSMWNWHDGKIALEWLFAAGEVSAAARPHFERLYDLTERVLPAEILAVPTPPEDEAQRELVRVSARALGVATEPDLRDYFRLRPADSRARVAELVEAGELVPVRVRGWPDPAYLWPGARMPRRITARALLSPFDSLIWKRERTERVFGFRFRLEIYVPAAKRVHGYYVLPFLLGDRLVARVDLKADRAAGMLRVRGAFAEHPSPPPDIADELAVELGEMAGWLGLDTVLVEPRGDLAPQLSAAVNRTAALPADTLRNSVAGSARSA
ncbi:MAG TPA: crosslink repair DNA glycosylase YcaQ family protein [Mycobacteriales bacterium]|nr:crosslink repair DNA glycosylase YcaQ family protein [Mycobacteriales bacterium]